MLTEGEWLLSSSLEEMPSGTQMGTSEPEGSSGSHPLLLALESTRNFLFWEQSSKEINEGHWNDNKQKLFILSLL